MHELKAGSVDQTIRFMLTKSDGTPYTGLVHSTPGLKCYYSRQGAASTEITLVDIPVIGTYTSSGFKAVDGTNMPGYYELGIPNAAIAAGTKFVDIMISGLADLYVCPQRIRLTGIDLDDATNAGLSTIAKFEFDGNNNVQSIPMSLSVDVNNMIANAVWLYGTLDELDLETAGGRLFRAQTGLDDYYTYTFDSYGNLRATMWDVESNARVAIGQEMWGGCNISQFDSYGTDTGAGRLKAILDKTANLPASPAAVGSPMTLADNAITNAKVANGAITFEKASVLVAGFEAAIDYTELADGVWATSVVHGVNAASNKLQSIFSKTANLPTSPAAVGSPMTLQDGAITSAKIADGAITSAKAVSVGNITGSVNNISSAESLSISYLAAIDEVVRTALGEVEIGMEAVNTLVTRMMGPGDNLWEFPVFKGPAPSTVTLPGATVWITDDEAGQIFYAGPQVSDANGITRWMVTTGRTYYIWCQMPHHSFSNPTEVTL